MTKTMKSIPVAPDQLREELNTSVQGCNNDPLYTEVLKHIQSHDEAIEAGAEGKKLGWVIDALQIHPNDVMRNKRMIETAVRVFHGIIKSLEDEAKKAEVQPQIELAAEMATELDQWGAAGWEANMQSFTREARGVNPVHLTGRLGFTAEQVVMENGMATLNLSDIVYRIVSDPKTLEDGIFRRFALNTFAAFYRYAFGATGSSDTDLLDTARTIDVSLYGEEKVAEREAERAGQRTTSPTQSPTNSNGTGGRKSDSKRRAQERGRAEYEKRQANPEAKRGYEQVGGKKGGK